MACDTASTQTTTLFDLGTVIVCRFSWWVEAEIILFTEGSFAVGLVDVEDTLLYASVSKNLY